MWRPVATLRPRWTGSRRVGDPQDSEGVRLPRHEFINRCPDDVLVHGRQAEPLAERFRRCGWRVSANGAPASVLSVSKTPSPTVKP